MVRAPDTNLHQFIDPQILQRVLKFADFGVLFVCSILLLLFAAEAPTDLSVVLSSFIALQATFAGLLATRWLHLYSLRNLLRPVKGTLAAAVTWSSAGVAMIAATDIILFDIDDRWTFVWPAVCCVYAAASRGLAAAWARPKAAAGAFRRRVAIVGGGQAAEDAINTLETTAGLLVDIVGLFDDREDERSPASIRKHAKLGKITDLARYSREHRIDLIIVAIPLSAEARLLQVLKRLWELPVDIRISGQSSKLKLSSRAYDYLGELPLLSVFERPLAGWSWVLKSAMDRVIAAGLIMLLSPVMLATAAIIRCTSKGPIIFRQRRYGFNNEMVEVFKFRSMYIDKSDADASKLVTKDDPRVTPIGRFIRKTSIDELPQLVNVLTGQLSLVGPRPHATQAKAADELYESVVDGYFARHKVKPGITGWAQINGWRGETDTKEKIENRVKYDLEYIDRWSLLFDLYILIKTPFALLKTENAY